MNDNARLVYDLVHQRFKKVEIAKYLDLHPTRIHQLYRRGKRLKQKEFEKFCSHFHISQIVHPTINKEKSEYLIGILNRWEILTGLRARDYDGDPE